MYSSTMSCRSITRCLQLSLLMVFVGCGEEKESAATASDCSTLSEARDKDDCLKAQILTLDASKLPDVKEKAAQINDPIIRGAAVERWVMENCNEVSLDQGRGLCELLEGRNKSYCERRLSSPHLCR